MLYEITSHGVRRSYTGDIYWRRKQAEAKTLIRMLEALSHSLSSLQTRPLRLSAWSVRLEISSVNQRTGAILTQTQHQGTIPAACRLLRLTPTWDSMLQLAPAALHCKLFFLLSDFPRPLKSECRNCIIKNEAIQSARLARKSSNDCRTLTLSTGPSLGPALNYKFVNFTYLPPDTQWGDAAQKAFVAKEVSAQPYRLIRHIGSIQCNPYWLTSKSSYAFQMLFPSHNELHTQKLGYLAVTGI